MDELLGQLFAYFMRSLFGGARGSRAVAARAAKRFIVPTATTNVFADAPPAPVQAPSAVLESPIDVRRPTIPKRPKNEPPAAEAPTLAPWAQQFRSPQGLLGAIVAGEVLGPPKSLR